MMKSKSYFLIVSFLFIYPFQAICVDIKKETTTKFLIQGNDTIIDFIKTGFYLNNGTILRTIWEEPLYASKTIDFYSDEQLWYSINYRHNLKEDSTMYGYNIKGDVAFTETFTLNNEIKRSVYNYSCDSIRKDNYQLGNSSKYVLISYEVTKVDSIAQTTFVKYVHLEDIYTSQINLFSFSQNDKLISIKTLNNLDNKKVIYELTYAYKDGQIHNETTVNQEGIISSITYEYTDMDGNGNWTKKTARITTKNGEQTEVGYEIRTIEYW